jgi:hypothetical protein
MHFDFTEKTARKRHNRRMALAAASALFLVVGSVAEFVMFMNVGVL